MKPKSDLETCLLIGNQDEKKPKPASPPPQVTVMRFDKLHTILFSTRLQICNAIIQSVQNYYVFTHDTVLNLGTTDLFMFFRTLFWDDITIFWDENLL